MTKQEFGKSSANTPLSIGLTYDLRDDYLAEGYGEEETAELDRPSTIEALETTLHELGHRPERIGHARQLMARLGRGDRWDLVLNIAEGLHGVGREALVPALLDLYRIPYTFSDPLVMALTLDKSMTKRVIRDAGLPTPDFVVVETIADARAIDLPLPLFAKPLAEGTSKGIDARSILRRREDVVPVCESLLERFHQPVLIETFLPGREFTTGLVGSGSAARVLGTLEVILRPEAEAEVYSYVNKERCEELVEYRLVHGAEDPEVATAEALALHTWRVLGCRDAGRVDLRSDAGGRPQVIEVNPLSGLHPEHSDLPILCTQLGISYATLLGWIVESARIRIL